MIFGMGRCCCATGLRAAVVIVASWCAGCQSPGARQGEIDASRVNTRDDVFQIVQFWPQMPWLQKGDRIVGFKVTVYFRSSATRAGTFVPGNILIWVYELARGADGRRERKLVHGWELTEAEALGFRVTKRAIMGYRYGFLLTWRENLRLEGKQVEIQFGYECADRRLVLSDPRQFRVPVPAGFEPPLGETER